MKLIQGLCGLAHAVTITVGLAGGAFAQTAGGPVALSDRGAAAKGTLARMPEVQPNDAVSAAIAAKINAALRREDDRAIAAAADCRTSFKEAQGKDPEDGWTRSADVTMAGPRYLAIVVSDSYYCGGPYPNDGLRSDFVYDVTTGRPVDWTRLFPKGATGKLDSAADGAQLGLIVWPELMRRVKAGADADCRAALEDTEDTGFTVGLDARSGELVAVPAEFPHVIQACADAIRLPVAELRKLGFAPELTDALEAAQRAQKR